MAGQLYQDKLQPRSVGGTHGGRAPPAEVLASPAIILYIGGHHLKKYGPPLQISWPPH